MSVPNTNTFSLQDIAGELNYDDYPTNTLIDDSHAPVDRLSANLADEKGAFKVALGTYPNGFNNAYAQEGFRMSEFRDFDKTRVPTVYSVSGGSWGYFNPWATSIQGGYVFTEPTRAVTVSFSLNPTPTSAGTNGVVCQAQISSNPEGMVASLSPTSFTGTNPSGSTSFSITLTMNANGNRFDDRAQPSREAIITYTWPGGSRDVRVLQLAGDYYGTGGGTQ